MKAFLRSLALGLAFGLGLASSFVTAQTVFRGLQLSQDTSGPLSVDTNFNLWLQQNKHILSSGSSPVLSACGTTPAIVGTDLQGTVTMGTGTPTGCVITFATAFASVPNCVINWQGTPLAAQNWTVTATAITLVQTATSSNKVNYICISAS